MTAPLRVRLFAQLAPCPDEGCDCLLWTGGKNHKGYGYIHIDGRTLRVHRVMWELEVGPIPDGLVIDHVRDRGCQHRNCAFIAHLEPVTNRENILRGEVGRTGTPGQRRPRRRKTHCKRGHEFTEANTYVNRGTRYCRACARERSQGGTPARDRTQCPQGHPYDEANTYRSPDGRRHCRTCAQAHRQAHRNKRRFAA